jgi:NitT/TauT family transport system ATP-binding protein
MDEGGYAVVADNLSFTYVHNNTQTEALRRVTFKVRRGEFVSIIGPSGCGKTTILRLVADLIQPTSGALIVNGKLPAEARKAHEFSFMFQDAALLEWRTALGNVMLPFELVGTNRAEAKRIAEKLLDLVGLSGFENRFPRQLSGGMRQRVCMGRALATNPPLLLMDEPFAALDQITRHRLNFELLRIWSTTEATVLFVTHNIREAILLSDRVIVLTTRPGTVMDDMHVGLPRPRTAELSMSAEFNELHVRGEQLLEEAIRES